MGGYAGGVSLHAADGELRYDSSALLIKSYNIKVGKLPVGKVKIESRCGRPWSGRRRPS
jgi:hypothetical protein